MAKPAEIKWFGKKVSRDANARMERRMRVASNTLRNLTVKNLSKPVRRIKKGKKTTVDPASRSKAGEFPRAETTRLMKSIFWNVGKIGRLFVRITGVVATSLFYGGVLETKRDRSFLLRTMKENKSKLNKILTKPKPPIL